MKKFFYNLMILAALVMTSVGMVSCGEDDDNGGGGSVPGTESYLVFEYWMSNDLADIVDVTTTGLTSFSCTTKKTVEYNGSKIDGVSSNKIEFAGDKATNAEFAINIKLKANWKDLVKNKTSVSIYATNLVGKSKGYSGELKSNMKGGTFAVSDILNIAEAQNSFINAVENKSFVYKK